MGKVYVVQNQTKFDTTQGKYVPRFDLSTAEKYGSIVYLLTPTAKPFDPQPIKLELHRKLKDFCEDDYILFIGNPIFMAMTAAIAADYNHGNLNVLQWHNSGKYIELKVEDLFDEKNATD